MAKRRSVFTAIFLTCVFFSVAAEAYTYPSFYLIRSLAKKHAPFEGGRVRSKVSFFNAEGEFIRSVTETVVIPDSQRAVIRLTNESGAEIALRSRKIPALSARNKEQDWPLTYDLLFVRDGATIFEHFKSLGFLLKTERELYWEKDGYGPYRPEKNIYFDRLDGRPALVLGAEGPASGADQHQLWLEKDTLLPLRFWLSDSKIEYRFSREYPLFKNFLYPRTISVLRNGILWAKIETLEVSPGLTAELEPARDRAEPSAEIREAMAQYFRWVR